MPGRSGLLSTKLQPGRIGADLVARPRLIETLSRHLGRRVTLICAPAGYGKSVLLVQFTRDCGIPSAWYQLDEFDNDLAVFLEYFVASIRRHHPTFGDGVLEIVEKSKDLSSEERRIVTYLVNDLDFFRESGLVIVLDDYHKVTDRSIHEFMEHLVEYLPGGVHIIISSRTRPPMRIPRLKLQGAMLEMGESNLRFTEEETTSVLGESGGSAESSSTLYRETHGWPAAVRLLTMATKNSDREPSLASPRTRREVYAYLASEVFDSLCEEEKSFLMRTSVFRVITPGLADKLLDRESGSAEILKSLSERGLFVSPLEGEDEAYRYHDLFRDFLKSRLGTMKASVLCRAGQCLFEDGQVERSVEFFLDAREYDRAVSAMVPAGQKGIRYGRWRTVARWVQRLPKKCLRISPWVGLYQAILAIYAGSLEEAEQILESTQEDFETAGDERGTAQTLIYRASILRLRGRYREGLRLIESALTMLDPSSLDLDASTEQAAAMYLQGDFAESIRVLKGRLAFAERIGDSYVSGTLLETLSTVYYMTGEYGKAVEAHQRAIELLPEPPYVDNMAAILAEWGDVEQAVNHAEERLRAMEEKGVAQTRPYGHFQCGVALMHKGDLEGATAHFQRAADMSRESGGGRFSEALNLSFLARCMALQGKADRALTVAETALSIGREQSPYVAAICTASLSHVLYASGLIEKAALLAEEAAAAFERFGATIGLMRCQALLGALALRRGARGEAVALMTSCMRRAAAEHCIQEFVTSFGEHEPVLALALEEGIEVEFVIRLVKRAGAKALPMLADLSAHKDPDVRARAVSALAATGQEGAREILVRLMNDIDVRVSDKALSALRNLGGPAAVAAASGPSTPHLRGVLFITCLGPFRVFSGDREIEMAWRTTKARDIFAYLIDRSGGPVSKERLLEDLWPDADAGQASTLFHTSLYQLRKALRDATGWEETVLYAGGHYRLAKGLVTTDVDRLERLSKDALEDSGSPRPAGSREDVDALGQTLSLFQGPYLEDLDYAWVTPERSRLDGLFAEVCERLGRRLMDLGEMAKAAAALRSLLHRNPLLEEVHCLLMTCYASMGDRMAVMQQYETLKDVLDRELGVDPAPKTRSLYYRLCGEPV